MQRPKSIRLTAQPLWHGMVGVAHFLLFVSTSMSHYVNKEQEAVLSLCRGAAVRGVSTLVTNNLSKQLAAI